MEAKLAMLEQGATEMENERETQYEQLDEILKIQKELSSEANKNDLIAKIDRVIIESEPN